MALDPDGHRDQGRTPKRDLRMSRQIITQGGKPAFVGKLLAKLGKALQVAAGMLEQPD
jgi:hypothetical protein